MLKLDPKNSTLLAQKQKILNEELTTSQEKLKQLKEVQQKYIDSGGDLNTENYRALEREIEKVAKQVKTLTLETNKFYQAGQKLTQVGEKLQGVGNKISSLGDRLTKIGTTAGLAIGGVAVKSAIEFESAFTGVKKTVEGTPEQLEKIKQGIKKLATEIPSTTTEIASVAEAAGQLGIATDDVLEFSKVMIDLGNSTNLSADEAASALAKFANITKTSSKDYSRLGSTIVDLGNNFATTEKDIVAMSTRLAATGDLAGLSQPQILALATAMNSVGIEAEAGGSAMSKLLKKMQVATEMGTVKMDQLSEAVGKYGYKIEDVGQAILKGGKTLNEFSASVGMSAKDLKSLYDAAVKGEATLDSFASVANMTGKEFADAFKKDAVGALGAFISGLNDTKRNGKSAIAILEDMNLKEVRLSNTILSLANSGDLMTRAIDLGNKAWDENTALSKEANQRYKTLESRLKTTKNNALNMATSLGDKLTPAINRMLDKVNKFIDKMSNLSDEEAENVLKMGLMVVAAGPVIKVLGSLTSGVGSVVKGIGTFSSAIGVMQTGVTTGNTSIDGLAKVLTGLTSPTGIATLAITGVVATIALISKSIKDAEKQTEESFKNMGNSANSYITGIQSAQSHLQEFNRTLFVSSEEQRKLEEEMQEVQKGITQICQTASKERRDYTQEEIKQLDEYFNKLRELNQRELEIEQSIATAISQQAKTTAESFEGSLEEYKTQSQEWIKTAEEQKTKEIELINTQTTEEIALLNQRFGEKATLENEAYKSEYDKIIENKENKIKQANDEVAEISSIYTKGYAERASQDGDFYEHILHYNWEQEQEEDRHNSAIESIQNNKLLTTDNKNAAIESENKRHSKEQEKIWKDMYKNMSDSESKQLGSWLGMLSQTELYGGQIDDETKKLVDKIIASYDDMPKGTREAMKNAMTPMLEEMEKKEPSLFSKATSIANGVLSRLRKAFDEHSPSKETRKIFKYLMQGAELGLDDEKRNLNKQIDEISKEALKNFNIADFGFNNGLKNNIIDSTKTIFTTPKIVFNVQELDEAKLQQCFNYINRKFGSAY